MGAFPVVPIFENADEIKEKVARLMLIRADVFKALEEARAEKIIGKSLEAHVMINVNDEDRALIEEYCLSLIHI